MRNRLFPWAARKDSARPDRRKVLAAGFAVIALAAINPALGIPRGSSAVVFPITQAVAFLSKSRQGYGGSDLQYKGSGTLTITSGNGAHLWAIDSHNCLVPASGSAGSGGNGSFTYGAAPASYASAVLTVSDGTLSSIVAVTVTTGGATIRANPTGTNADSTAVFQLKTMLELASTATGALVGGDTIVCRDSYLNAAAADFRVRPPATNPFWATGRVTVQSENPNYAVDQYALPYEGGGFQVGHLLFDATLTGSVAFPIDFKYVSFYTNNSSAPTSLFSWPSALGYDTNFYNCNYTYGPLCTSTTIVNSTAVNVHSQGIVQDCRFTDCGNAVVCTTPSPTQFFTVNRCLFEGQWNDGIHGGGENWTITNNFMKNWNWFSGTHPDPIQHVGFQDNAQHYNFTITENVIGGGPVGSIGQEDAQSFVFFGLSTGTSGINDLVVTNNITCITGPNIVAMTLCNAPVINCNTFLTDVTKSPFLQAQIVSAAPGGTGATINNTVANLVNMAAQSGTITQVETIPSFSQTLAAYLIALPNWQDNWQTRPQALAAMTPAVVAVASGGFAQPSGDYSGCLFPDGSKNDGNPYVPGRLPPMN